MCKINQQNKEGHTPLIVAAINNQLAVAKILLCFDADLNAEDCNGCTALHIVLENYQRTQLSNEEMSAVNPKIVSLFVTL